MSKPYLDYEELPLVQLMPDLLLSQNTDIDEKHHINKLRTTNRLLWLVCTVLGMLAVLFLATMILIINFNSNPTFLQDFLTTYKFDSQTIQYSRLRQYLDFTDSHTSPNHRTPLPIHSHNDYLRETPLFDALRLGINSVEADVWHLPQKPEQLYVGHTRMSLSSYRTLDSLYLGVIENLLDDNNGKEDRHHEKKGVFVNDPSKTLYLIIDFKNDPQHIWDTLQKKLAIFQDKSYLTTYNTETQEWSYGPLTILLSGDFPYEQVKSQRLRNCFIDAPLRDLISDYEEFVERYDDTISIFGSSSLRQLTGSSKALAGNEGLSSQQLEQVARIVTLAHGLNIKTRIWETPKGSDLIRSQVWKQLLEQGVDVLNVDALSEAVEFCTLGQPL